MSSTILGGDVTVYFLTDNNQLRWEWTGAADGTRTMNEVYSASKTLEALSAQMSERIWLTAQTPVDYTTVNGYFVDDTTMEHMTGGTNQSSGWASLVVLQKPYQADSPQIDFVAADIGRTIVTDTEGYSGTILDYNTSREIVWIRPDDPTVDLFDNDTDTYTVTGGTGDSAFTGVETSGESIWANPNTIASLADNTLVYVYQGAIGAVVGSDNKSRVVATKGTDSWWPEGNIDICLKVQEAGTLIDEGYATFFAHQYTQTYSHSVVDLSAGARTPIALETQDDLNNNSGHRQFLTNAETPTADSWSSSDVGVRISEVSPGLGWEAVLTSVTGTGPNYTMQYYPVADLTDASASDIFEDSAGTKTATITGAAPTGVNPEAAPDSGITITHTAIDRNLNNGAGSRPYSIEIDVNLTPIQDMYELTKYDTKRGSTTTDTTDGVEGEQYIGNELQVEYSGMTGAFVEGEQLWFHDVSDVLVATGIVVADHTGGSTGDIIMRNMRTYTSNTITQVGDHVTQASYTDFATVDSTRSVTPVKAAVFGTFAGGVFFGAPGVWVTNLFSGDEQAFQLTDDDGSTQLPPNTVSVNVTNLVSGDTVAVFRRVSATAGSAIDRAEYNPNATQGPATSTTAGTATLTVTGAISNEAPDAGKVQVVDVSNNNETIRYRYDTVTRAAPGVFNLLATTGTCDAGGDGTNLVALTPTNFVTDGVEIGDIARNITDGSEAVVTAITDGKNLVTTQLTGGGTNDWASADDFEINILAREYVAGDDVWVPFILRTADATNEANSIIHTVDIPVRVVVRNAGVVEPQEFDQTIESTGMTQAMIRNPDTIYVA
jgi:hypothetical protein